jgi:glycine/D-amino acid oxidase-like deaminating enzyme
MNDSDAIVVGGGLVGAALAVGLADAGLSVTVLDEGDVAFRASTGNFGLVWMQGKGEGMPAYVDWTHRSTQLWPQFAERLSAEIGIDIGYRKPGGVHLCLDEEEMAERVLLVRRMHNQTQPEAYDCRPLDRQEVRDMVPGLGPAVVGGTYCPHDGHVSPLLLLKALHKAMTARKVAYRPLRPVISITKKGEYFRVDCAGEHFFGHKLVLAAGLGNRLLCAMVGIDMPVSPLKGQILVTERCKPFLGLPTSVVRQTTEGTILLGDSHEDVGFNRGSTTKTMAMIAARAVRIFPVLADLRVVRAWAALRIMTPDGFPIYQESTSHPGAFGIACHSGVTLAAAHAVRLAPAIIEGRLDTDFAAFNSKRFHAETT